MYVNPVPVSTSTVYKSLHGGRGFVPCNYYNNSFPRELRGSGKVLYLHAMIVGRFPDDNTSTIVISRLELISDVFPQCQNTVKWCENSISTVVGIQLHLSPLLAIARLPPPPLEEGQRS